MSGLFVALGKRWGELRIESGTTPLTLACYKGDVAAISDLLQKGAGVDQQDDDGYTPLFVASLKGHVDAARLLLDAGATVDKRREGDWSPFGIASVRGHVDVATLLVDRGAAVDMCLDGTTPLLVASRNQNLDGAFTVPDDTKKRAVWLWDEETVAKALEEAELDVSAPNRNGRDILLGGGGDDWTEDESDKVMEEFHRVALKFMQDQARAGDGAFTVPDDTKRRAVWLWDEETVAEVLEELEDEMEGSAPKLNGKQLLLGEGDWAEGDSDKVMEMIRRCAILFMQDMAMRDDDDAIDESKPDLKRAVWLWDEETVAKALEEAELDVSAPNRNGRDILLGGGGDDWTEDESDKVMEEFHRVALKFMQDQARAGDGAFTVPDDTKRRAVWLWDEETVAEVLEELEDEMEGSAPKLNGKQLLLGEGDWAEGDSDKVMEMIRRCAILFMQDMAMRDDDD